MAIPAISGQGGSVALGSLSNTQGADSNMDKEQFLQLLVMQLTNQDPMEPKDPSEFVAQLTQFTSLEQLANISQGLAAMAMTQTSATHASMVQFVGKEVEFADSTLTLDENSESMDLNYSLGGKADSVTIMVQDSDGNKVKTIELGARELGKNAVPFDGIDENGLKLPPGDYTFSVSARTANDEVVTTNTIGSGIVQSITFENGYPELIMSDGRRIDLGQVLAVSDPGAAAAAMIEEAVDEAILDKPTEHTPIDEEVT